MFFRKKYGHLAFFTLPSGFISVVSIIFLLTFLVYNVSNFLSEKLVEYNTIGFNFHSFRPEWFFVNTQAIMFVSIVLYGMVITALLIGRKMTEGKVRISFNIIYFLTVYSVLAPFWMSRAIYNSIRSKQSSWTAERDVK